MRLELYAWTPPGVRALPVHKRGGIRCFAWVDEEDWPLVSQHRWHLAHGYVMRRAKKEGLRQTTLPLHREIMGLQPGDRRQVDHRNHRPTDCRRRNMRVVSLAENHQNRQSWGDRNTSSKYRGVSWNKRSRKWWAYYRLNGQLIVLGYYHDEDEAGRVAAEARALHMPFSTN